MIKLEHATQDVKSVGHKVTEKDKEWTELKGNLKKLKLVFDEGTVCFTGRAKGYFQFKNAKKRVYPNAGEPIVLSQTIGRVLNENGDCEMKTFDFASRTFITRKSNSGVKIFDSKGESHRNQVTRRYGNINDMKLDKSIIK